MSVVSSYAKALYESAQDARASQDSLDEIENQLQLFSSFMDSSKDVRIALLAPLTSLQEKVALVEAFSQRLGLSHLTLRFLILLARKGRLSFLSQLKEAFVEIRLEREGGLSGRLVAAEPMSKIDISTLVKAFSHKLGKKVAFQVSTDPSLLAGMKVTVNGVTYDGTLRSQLQKLRDRFVTGLSVTQL